MSFFFSIRKLKGKRQLFNLISFVFFSIFVGYLPIRLILINVFLLNRSNFVALYISTVYTLSI